MMCDPDESFDVSGDEWSAVWSLVSAIDPGETDEGGVVIHVRDGRRTWSCGRPGVIATIDGGPVEPELTNATPIVLPARLVAFATAAAHASGSCAVHRRIADGTVVVGTDDMLQVADHPADDPTPPLSIEVDSMSATIGADALLTLLRHTMQAPTGVDLDAAREVWTTLFTEDGILGSFVPWGRVGARSSTIRVKAETSGGATATADLWPLLAVCERLNSESMVTVRIPIATGGVIRLSGEGWSVKVDAVDQSAEGWRPRLECALQDLGCITHLEPDGTYLLGWYGSTLRVGLVDGPIQRVRVRRTLVSDIAVSASLLEELNALSSGLSGIRVWWEDRAVVAVAEVPCDELDGLERSIVDLVQRTSDLGRLLGSIAA
jgi:hypothetical protein